MARTAKMNKISFIKFEELNGVARKPEELVISKSASQQSSQQPVLQIENEVVNEAEDTFKLPQMYISIGEIEQASIYQRGRHHTQIF